MKTENQEPIGYLFEDKIYQSLDELRGRTMSEFNKLEPVYATED